MLVDARYLDPRGLPKRIRIKIRGGNLLVFPPDSAKLIEKWPVSSLTQTTGATGKILLEWQPGPAKIEVSDLSALRRAGWSRKLPGGAGRSPLYLGAVWLGGSIVVIGMIAFFLPALAARVPWPVETFLFRHFTPYQEQSLCRGSGNASRKANDNFDRIVKRIYPIYAADKEFPLEVSVVRGTEINAFATPGARIFLVDGLLQSARTPEEVAGILAHEIEHVRRRHVIQMLIERSLSAFLFSLVFPSDPGETASLVDFLMHAGFGRMQEHEADEGAVARLTDAGVDRAGIESFFKRMASQSSVPVILSDHPSDESRQELFRSHRGGVTRPILSEEDWAAVKQICSP